MEYNKYINRFATEEEYENYTYGDIIDIPNVALIDAIGGGVIYLNKIPGLLMGTTTGTSDFMIGHSTPSGTTTPDCIKVHVVQKEDENNEMYVKQKDILKTPVSLFEAFKGDEGNKITSIYKWKIDTSRVTDMNSMFKNCKSLTSLDVSGFDTSSVTDMSEMFESCKSLVSLDLSSFDTSKVTNMTAMFNGCESLASLDLSNFNTSKVTRMEAMFSSCSSLTSLNLSSFDTSSVTNMRGILSYCNKINKLYLSNNFFNSTALTTYEFQDLTAWTDANSLAQFVDAISAHDGSGKTVKLSTNTKNALTQTQKDAITAKGWTIS